MVILCPGSSKGEFYVERKFSIGFTRIETLRLLSFKCGTNIPGKLSSRISYQGGTLYMEDFTVEGDFST